MAEMTDRNGNLVAKYVQGSAVDEPLAESTSGGTDYYEQDGLGSVTSLTATNGSVAQSYTYDSFGNTTNSSGSLTNFFRYTGREFDSETGLYYYRARYYDPSTGRFLSEDPANFRSDANFYRYVSDSPVNLSDPFGLCWVYHQSSGKLYWDPGTGFDPQELNWNYYYTHIAPTQPIWEYVARGYSGIGLGFDNPALQNLPYNGPIQQGTYTIGPMLPKGPGKTGVNVMHLNPVGPFNPNTGRSGFYFHGNDKGNPNGHTASDGCIIMPPNIRKRIRDSGDHCLVVVP